jgi:hypothetical protein
VNLSNPLALEQLLLLGADLGVLSPTAFFWLVAMALFTTVITTPILRRAYPRPETMEGWEPGAEGRRH